MSRIGSAWISKVRIGCTGLLLLGLLVLVLVSRWCSTILVSHTQILLSKPPDIKYRASGENLTTLTHLVCLLIVDRHSPVPKSHNLIVKSVDPVAINLESTDTS